MTALDVVRLDGPARAVPRIEGVSLGVPSGGIAAVFGPGDAGTGALLRLLTGLDRHEQGDIILDGLSVASQPVHHRRIGAVLRDAALFPGTVRDNVIFGLRRGGWAKNDRERRVSEALELTGMTGSEGDPVETLTEGERMRVALARAIAPRPAVLLIESPVWSVDEVLRPEYRARLRELLRSIEVTTLIATDDLRDAVGIADDLHVMADGRILQSGTLSRVLAGPNSVEVAEMVGYVTLVHGEVDGAWILEPGAGAIRYPEGFPLSGTARALAHPSTMLGVPEDSGLGCGVTGLVERVRATGPAWLADLRVGDRTVEVRWEWDADPPALGRPISIAVTPDTLRFFNARGAGPSRPNGRRPLPAPAPEADDLDDAPDDAATNEPEHDEPPEDAALDEPPEDKAREGDTPEDDGDPDAPDDEDGDDDRSALAASVLAAAPPPPSPAPAPPRQSPAAASEGAPSNPGLAPWVGASRPPPAPSSAPPESPADRHRGMPLD